MTADDVLSVLALMRRAEVGVWIGGGWGIDALLGKQTREHRDLDLMHPEDREDDVVRALNGVGFVESLNWRPVRFVVAASDGREIDLHPSLPQRTAPPCRHPSTRSARSSIPRRAS